MSSEQKAKHKQEPQKQTAQPERSVEAWKEVSMALRGNVKHATLSQSVLVRHSESSSLQLNSWAFPEWGQWHQDDLKNLSAINSLGVCCKSL